MYSMSTKVVYCTIPSGVHWESYMTCIVTKLLYFTIPSGGRWESYIIFEILVISVKP